MIDPESFDQLAGILPKKAHNAMMREAGFDGMVIRDKCHDPAVARVRASRQMRVGGRFAPKADMPF